MSVKSGLTTATVCPIALQRILGDHDDDAQPGTAPVVKDR